MAGERKGRIVDSFQGVNGHTGIPKSRRMKPRQSFFRWLLSTGTWLLTWYSIITVIFQCPESPELITESSPHICKPYFKVKSSLAPYASPYYEKYAAPYVDSARPYYNVLDKNVITPVAFYGKKYGAPRVAQAQAIGREQWERQIQPQVAMLNQLAHQQYNKTLAPHVQTAVAATMPYAKFAKENALQTYYTAVLPAYAAVEPYAQHAYEIGKSFTVNVGIPYVQWAWASGVIFLDRTIWPKAKILYGENVEPQLIRIGERLGRYRDGKKLKSSVDEVSVSSTTSVFSSISSEVPTVATPDVPVTSSTSTASSTSSAPSEESSPVPLSADEERANAQKIVAEDLKTWQEKFAKAADKGSDELDQRIAEITDRAIHKQVQGVGEAHLIVLEETVKSQIKSFKAAIISIVKLQGGEDDINAATRKAGLAIRDKAQAVRTWRRSFDQETNELISMASEDTFQIIDHIRDLGLQEIGMRWAWTDGITHKDWAKYHALKNKFDEWRHDVEDVITGHPGVEDSRAASEDIENRAMAIAEDAAKELARLKETGKWKLAMGDASDDFSTQRLPAPAAAVKQKVVEKAREASETVGGYVQDSASASSVAGNIKAYASEVSESVADAASSVSSSVVGSSQGAAESLVSAAQASLGSLVEKASNAVVGTSQGTLESAGSIVGDSASSILGNASSSAGEVFDAASSTVSSAFSAVKNADPSSEVVSTSITPPKATGSEASIPNEQESYSEKLQNVAAEAGEQLADVTNAVSEALQQTKGKGIAEGATSIAADQYSSALSAASVALHGTEQDADESIASVASDKYADAVSAASSVIYDTPTPSIDMVIAQASSAYDDAVRQAQERMTRASSVVSAMVSGTPKPIHENMFSSVRAAYSDSVAAASSRLEAAISAATEVVNAASEGVEDFATSVSSAAGSSATSAKDEL